MQIRATKDGEVRWFRAAVLGASLAWCAALAYFLAPYLAAWLGVRTLQRSLWTAPIQPVLVPLYSALASGFIMLSVARGRALACMVLSLSITLVPAWCVLFMAEPTVWHAARPAILARVAKGAQPLIDAIRAFTVAEGRAPTDLSELVPRYIARIPTTRIGTGQFE